MKKTFRFPKPLIVILMALLTLSVSICPVYTQEHPNTVTFINRSGEPALVKLVGPSRRTVDVPDKASRAVHVAGGQYYVLVRYGHQPDKYTYTRGDPFSVEQTDTQYSEISITLHKVVGGNYRTRQSSREEFGSASP